MQAEKDKEKMKKESMDVDDDDDDMAQVIDDGEGSDDGDDVI